MPTTDSSVGPLALPLSAVSGAIDDPTLTGLGAYLAFGLNADLNPQLAQLKTGRAERSTLVTTAVPTGNVFAWNPLKPIPLFVRGKGDGAANPLPALYMTAPTSKGKAWSQVFGMRERLVRAIWIFEEATLPDWNVDRYGLRNAACASMFRRVEQRWDPAYNARQTIAVQLGLCGEGIIHQGSEETDIAFRPATKAGQAEQPKVRAYPAAIVTMLVYERDNGMIGLPSDGAQDLQVRTSVSEQGDLQDALLIGELVLPAGPYTDTV